MYPLLDTPAERRLVHRFLLEHYGTTDEQGSRVLTGARAAVLDAHREVKRQVPTGLAARPARGRLRR